MPNQELIHQINQLVDEHINAGQGSQGETETNFSLLFGIHNQTFECMGDELATTLYSAKLFYAGCEDHPDPKKSREQLDQEKEDLEFKLYRCDFTDLSIINQDIDDEAKILRYIEMPVLVFAGLHFKMIEHPQLFKVLANLFHQQCRQAYQSPLSNQKDQLIRNIKNELFQLFLSIKQDYYPHDPQKQYTLAVQFWNHAKLLNQQFPLSTTPAVPFREDEKRPNLYIVVAIAFLIPMILMFFMDFSDFSFRSENSRANPVTIKHAELPKR